MFKVKYLITNGYSVVRRGQDDRKGYVLSSLGRVASVSGDRLYRRV